jgi:hypothetical protein
MASPFAFFRKNQRAWMAALVIVAIVSFVILPNLDDFVRPDNQNRRNTQTLVSWKGGNINADKLEKYQMVHAQTYNIFSRMANEVIQAGGMPKVPGFSVGPQGIEIGIEQPQNIQSVLQVRLMAEAAKKRGVIVDDRTVDQFIQNFSDKRISAKRFAEIISEVAGQSLTKFDMYDFLRDEIAKQLLVQMGYSGLAFSQQSLVSPSKNWMNYQKFQQRAKIEAYPVFVDQYLDKVTAKPSEQELRLLYDKAKDLISFPGNPEPGFRLRYRANIEFLLADLNVFLKDEESKITDEVLKTTYESRVKEGAYKVPVDEFKPTTPAAPADKPASETPVDDKPSENKPSEDKPAAADKPSKEEPTKDKPAKEEPGKDESAKEPAEGKAAEAPSTSDKPEVPSETPAQETPPKSESSRREERTSMRLVAFQEEKAEVKTEVKAEVTSEDAVKPAETSPDAKTEVAKTDDAKSTDSNAEKKEPEKPTRTRTFEEVQQDLRRELAMQPAQQRLQGAVNKARDVMDNYTNQLQLYRPKEPQGPDNVKPNMPSLVEIASQLGLSYGKTGMVDSVSVEELPIGRSFTNFDSGQSQGYNFEMFARSVFTNRLRLLQPATSQGFAGGTSQSFVFWKIEEANSRVPPYDEVREQVLSAWKLAEARKLATKAAEELAGSINSGNESDPWTRLLDKSLQPLVLKPPMFTWLQPMLTGNEGIQPSMVEGIDQAGQAFMEKSFSTPIGKAAVAMDAAQMKCFVIRVVERNPNDEQLLTEFEKAPLSRGVQSLAIQQTSASASRWFDSLVEELDVDMSKLSTNPE